MASGSSTVNLLMAIVPLFDLIKAVLLVFLLVL